MRCSLLLTVLLGLGPLGLTPSASAAEPVKLFNGKDFTGWTHVLMKEGVPMTDVWSVGEGGVLRCTGNPAGYLRTVKDYEDYRLKLQWRWPEKPGNNGVLVHTSTPDELYGWPKSLEVQLHHENAGDFWVIGTQIDTPNEPENPKNRRHVNLTDGSEKPLGEWNQLEIVCRGASVTVHVNGELVNEGKNSTETRGAISLQSEGAPIEYREILLESLGE